MIIRHVFFFNDTATTEIYTLSLHDALPISGDAEPSASRSASRPRARVRSRERLTVARSTSVWSSSCPGGASRSEEHTSELQSRQYLVCRLLLEKKKTFITSTRSDTNYAALQ